MDELIKEVSEDRIDLKELWRIMSLFRTRSDKSESAINMLFVKDESKELFNRLIDMGVIIRTTDNEYRGAEGLTSWYNQIYFNVGPEMKGPIPPKSIFMDALS